MLQKCYPVYVKVENECFIFRCLEYKRRTETLPELYLLKCPDQLYFWKACVVTNPILMAGRQKATLNQLSSTNTTSEKNWFFW